MKRITFLIPSLSALLLVSSPNSVLAQAATTAFPLGVYVANPDGNDASKEQYFETSYNAFVKDMGGAHPLFFNAFTDFSQDPSQWAANASWTAWSANLSGAAYVGSASGATPVVGVPMASTVGGKVDPDGYYQNIIPGKYDEAYRGVVDAWAGQGYKTVEFRNCWEFNGPFMPCDPVNSSSPTAVADFITAFRHIADIEHSQGKNDGLVVKVEWNPDSINWTGFDVSSAYPGDTYVDIISVDAYSSVYPRDLTNWSDGGKEQVADLATWVANPANRAHFWQYSNASQWEVTPGLGYPGWSFQDTIDLAKAHNKPIAVDESGAGPAGDGTHGPADDPDFVKWLHDALAAAESNGVAVDHVDIWDATMGDGDWNFSNGSKPLEEAAYTKYFGAGSTSGTSTGSTSRSSSSASTISSSAWYNVVNQHSSDCVDTLNWGTTDGTAVQQWACGTQQANQEWQFVPTDSGYYKLLSRGASSEVLDVSGQGTGNGTGVTLWSDNGGTNQQWMPVAFGDGTYKLVGRGSGKCLDVPGASTASGVLLEIYDCNGTPAQAFVLNQQP